VAILQSIPTGFLSLLGIKTGSNPNQSADFVQPVLSLDTFYLATSIDMGQALTALNTNVGDRAELTIPSGQAWRVLALSSLILVPSAPAIIRLTTAIVNPTLPNAVGVLPGFDVNIAAANDTAENGIALPQPIVFPTGTIFRTELMNDLGAVTVTLGIRALFQRLVV
jgi:hypothetical protein